MKDSSILLLAAGAGAYYYFFMRPQAQAISPAPQNGLLDGLFSLLNPMNWTLAPFALPTAALTAAGAYATDVAAQQKAGQDTAIARQEQNLIKSRQAAIQAWQGAGGTMQGQAFVLPAPMGQWKGLTVQQPSSTAILTALAGQGQPQGLNTITTIQDVARVNRVRQEETAIKQAIGGQVVGHRTQGGQEIYTVRQANGTVQTVVR